MPQRGSTPTLVVHNCEKRIAVTLGDPVSYKHVSGELPSLPSES